jgi:hypothetical protein
MAMSPMPGIALPDSMLAREITQYIRDTESEVLFYHSARVYCWGAYHGIRHGMRFDAELLYAAAMFHDLGITPRYHDSPLRFEVDGANAARVFLQERGVAAADIEKVWLAVALHTTPGIPEHMHSEACLVQCGAGMDMAGRNYDSYTEQERAAVLAAYPRAADFASQVVDTFYQGLRQRPATTFGTFNDDFLAFKDPAFQRTDLCSLILNSRWTR